MQKFKTSIADNWLFTDFLLQATCQEVRELWEPEHTEDIFNIKHKQ